MPVTSALPKPPKTDPSALVLPHNLEAEQIVLGASMLQPATADYVTDKLAPADFFRRDHAAIFEAIKALRQQNAPADLLPIANELKRRKYKLDGELAYVAHLIDGVPARMNVPHYVEILRDLHSRRALQQYALRTLDYVAEGAHSGAALLADADRRLTELQAGHLESRVLPLKDTVGALVEDLEWRAANAGKLIGLETGYKSINDLTWGWQAGDLNVIGARPSIGKTTLLLNTAVHAARTLVDKAVLLFSFEMSRRQLEYRLLSHLSGIPLTRLLGGVILPNEGECMQKAIAQMVELPIEIDDQAGQTRWQVRSKCRQIKAARGLALVGVDYLQLMPGCLERRGATRNEEIADISRGIKELANELNVPILLLSQLSRPNRFMGRDSEPKLTDLRDSGSIEQDADNVGFLHRKNHRAGGATQFILAKQRNGPTGAVMLTLDRDVVTFTDGGEIIATPESEQVPAKPPKKVRVG